MGVRRAHPDGELKVVAERKRLVASSVASPLLRGPARLVESVAFLPRLRQLLPEARLPFERAARVRDDGRDGGRDARRPAVAAQRVGKGAPSAGCSRSRRPMLALRGGELAAYHGAEHITIGSYEHGEPRATRARALRHAPRRPAARDRRRSGTCLPRAPPSASGRPPAPAATRRRGRGADRDLRLDAAQSRSTRSRARLRSRATSSSTGSRRLSRPPEQLEVAEAALAACLELELAPL